LTTKALSGVERLFRDGDERELEDGTGVKAAGDSNPPRVADIRELLGTAVKSP
jgi:hypothetical protein